MKLKSTVSTIAQFIICFCLMFTAAITIAAAAPLAESDIKDNGWPRSFDSAGYNVIVYQPQVEKWPDFERITFRSAISIGKKGNSALKYGTIFVSAKTSVSLDERLVLLTDRKVEEVSFPDASAVSFTLLGVCYFMIIILGAAYFWERSH